MKPALTESIQNYLRALYLLGEQGGRISVTALARRPHVSAGSASAMVKKLAAHAPYHGIVLAPAGERVALEVIRHHRLLELYPLRRSGSMWTLSTTKPTSSSTC